MPTELKLQIRQDKAVPILKTMKEWLDISFTQVTPSGLTGKALSYLSNQWPTLIIYCEAGRLDIDNNAVERAQQLDVIRYR